MKSAVTLILGQAESISRTPRGDENFVDLVKAEIMNTKAEGNEEENSVDLMKAEIMNTKAEGRLKENFVDV